MRRYPAFEQLGPDVEFINIHLTQQTQSSGIHEVNLFIDSPMSGDFLAVSWPIFLVMKTR